MSEELIQSHLDAFAIKGRGKDEIYQTFLIKCFKVIVIYTKNAFILIG